MIRFLQPWWLLAVLSVLLVAGAYVLRQFRRRTYAMKFTNVELLRSLAPKGLGWRRHVAAGAFLLSLLSLAFAMARPSIDREEPLERATVMLAIDVSLSMEADDVQPNRIEAAQEAAKAFVQELPPTYNLGLVSFAKSANVLVSPTKDRAAVISGIDGLTLAEATATGEAVFTSLDAIRTVPADGADGAPPARIVLLSDGYRTSGRSVEDAADRLRYGHRRGRHPRPAAAGAGGPAVVAAARGEDQGLLLRGGLGLRAEAGVRGHGQLDRAPGGAPRGHPVVRRGGPAARTHRRGDESAVDVPPALSRVPLQGALCASTKRTTTQAAAMVKVSGATNLLMAVTFRWVTDRESAHQGSSRPASGSVAARHDVTAAPEENGATVMVEQDGCVSAGRTGTHGR
jgi:hypothetical protein